MKRIGRILFFTFLVSILVLSAAITAGAEAAPSTSAEYAAQNGFTLEGYDTLTANQREAFDRVLAEVSDGYTSADGVTQDMLDAFLSAASAMDYVGVSARMSGVHPGIRAQFTVDMSVVNALSEKYRVTYGALMGVGEYDGKTVNQTETLTVKADAAKGYVAENANASAVVVYDSNGAAYATYTFNSVKGNDWTFTYTSMYSEDIETKFGYTKIGLVYRGYLVLNYEGADYVFYFDADSELFGNADATCGEAITALELSRYLTEVYTDASGSKPYAKNGLLRSVVLKTLETSFTVTAEEIEKNAEFASTTLKYYYEGTSATLPTVVFTPGAKQYFTVTLNAAHEGFYAVRLTANSLAGRVNELNVQNLSLGVPTGGVTSLSNFYNQTRLNSSANNTLSALYEGYFATYYAGLNSANAAPELEALRDMTYAYADAEGNSLTSGYEAYRVLKDVDETYENVTYVYLKEGENQIKIWFNGSKTTARYVSALGISELKFDMVQAVNADYHTVLNLYDVHVNNGTDGYTFGDDGIGADGTLVESEYLEKATLGANVNYGIMLRKSGYKSGSNTAYGNFIALPLTVERSGPYAIALAYTGGAGSFTITDAEGNEIFSAALKKIASDASNAAFYASVGSVELTEGETYTVTVRCGASASYLNLAMLDFSYTGPLFEEEPEAPDSGKTPDPGEDPEQGEKPEIENDRNLESVGALPMGGSYGGDNRDVAVPDETDEYPDALPKEPVSPTVVTVPFENITFGNNSLLSDNVTLLWKSGSSNKLVITVEIPTAGIYGIDWSAVTGGAYITTIQVTNKTKGAPLTTKALGRFGVKGTAVADTSNDFYMKGEVLSGRIAEQYFAAGTNTVQIYFSSENSVPVGLRSLSFTRLSEASDGSVLVPAPSYIDNEQNYDFETHGTTAPNKASTSGGPLLRVQNFVEYDITVDQYGEYIIYLLGSTEASTKITVSESNGKFTSFTAQLDKTNIGGSSTSSVQSELGRIRLEAGTYRIRVYVEEGWAHFTALLFARETKPVYTLAGYLNVNGVVSVALDGLNVPSDFYAILKLYDKNGKLVGYDYERLEEGKTYLQSACADFEHLRVLVAKDIAATDPVGMLYYLNAEYKVVFLSDTHLFDVDGLYGMTSIERLQMAVEQILWEHQNNGKIDLVIMPGDFCNNLTKESYAAGYVDKVMDSMGTKQVIVYENTVATAGASGSDNDPLYLARLAKFKELIKPLEDAGIEVYTVHGNHDVVSHRTFEAGFGYSQRDRYLAGCFEDKDGNLITDAGGKNYAIALNDKTAFLIFDCFDGENNGFTNNASGRNWEQTVVSQAVVDYLWEAVKDYEEVYVVVHTYANHMQPALAKLIAENDNVLAVFDGHTHTERVTTLFCGKQVFTCGYVGIPILEYQPTFADMPWSFFTLERSGITGSISGYITLFGHEYPEYTYESYSGCTTEAFTQAYERRTPPKYIRKIGEY